MRRALLLAACAVLLGACQTVLSTQRATPGTTVSVTPYYEYDVCREGHPVEVRMDLMADFEEAAADGGYAGTGEVVGSGVAGPDGWFSIDITAPAELDRYAVWVECSSSMGYITDDEGNPVLDEDENPIPGSLVLGPADLVVHAPLVLSATPDEVQPGGAVTISGPWCVSQQPGGATPVVEVTFLGETHVLETEESQPFDEVWELELTAPDEAGTFPVTAACSYDDGVSEEDPGEEDPGEDQLDLAAIVADEYAPASVVVVAQPTTSTTGGSTSTTSSTSTSSATPSPTAAAPRAVTAQPTYTG